jgi:hypothetical protein
VHFGPIASGDQLMRDERRRDELAQRHQVLAFEMEATGVAVAAALRGRPTLIVRGISDYGDRTKNGLWQPYAALAAAAYLRAVLAECRDFSPGRAGDGPNGAAREAAVDASVPPWPVLVELADSLLKLPFMADDRGWQALIGQLRPAIRGSLRRNAALRLEVIEMMRLVFNYAGGPQELRDAVARLDADSVPAARFATRIEGVLPASLTDEPSAYYPPALSS